jgi:hypothetical protein
VDVPGIENVCDKNLAIIFVFLLDCGDLAWIRLMHHGSSFSQQ